jgi:hypothetical protein
MLFWHSFTEAYGRPPTASEGSQAIIFRVGRVSTTNIVALSEQPTVVEAYSRHQRGMTTVLLAIVGPQTFSRQHHRHIYKSTVC